MATTAADKISIIPADKTIVKNGKALKLNFSTKNSKIRAIQWNGASGEIEMSEGASQYFDNFAMISEIVALYDIAEAEQIAAELAASAAAAAAEAAV